MSTLQRGLPYWQEVCDASLFAITKNIELGNPIDSQFIDKYFSYEIPIRNIDIHKPCNILAQVVYVDNETEITKTITLLSSCCIISPIDKLPIHADIHGTISYLSNSINAFHSIKCSAICLLPTQFDLHIEFVCKELHFDAYNCPELILTISQFNSQINQYENA